MLPSWEFKEEGEQMKTRERGEGKQGRKRETRWRKGRVRWCRRELKR